MSPPLSWCSLGTQHLASAAFIGQVSCTVALFHSWITLQSLPCHTLNLSCYERPPISSLASAHFGPHVWHLCLANFPRVHRNNRSEKNRMSIIAHRGKSVKVDRATLHWVVWQRDNSHVNRSNSIKLILKCILSYPCSHLRTLDAWLGKGIRKKIAYEAKKTKPWADPNSQIRSGRTSC